LLQKDSNSADERTGQGQGLIFYDDGGKLIVDGEINKRLVRILTILIGKVAHIHF